MRRLMTELVRRLGLRPRQQRRAEPLVRVEEPVRTDPAVRPARPQPAPRPRPPTSPTSTVVATPPRQGRHLEYAPQLDGHADPGEIVWTRVPYEDDPQQGKDRPVLVVGRDAGTLYGLMLSSNAHRDGQPNWYALGAGAWDAEHRPSWVRLDRIIVVAENSIRREGAILDRRRFDAIASRLREAYGWN